MCAKFCRIALRARLTPISKGAYSHRRNFRDERHRKNVFRPSRPRWVQRHADDVLGSLERDVFPMLGEFPPGELTPPLILACLRQVESRGAIETASRLRQRIDAVLSYGLSMGLIASNPAPQVKGALKPVRRGKRQPAVTDLDELRELLRKSEASGAYPVTLLASRFLAITAQRPGAIEPITSVTVAAKINAKFRECHYFSNKAANLKETAKMRAAKMIKNAICIRSLHSS